MTNPIFGDNRLKLGIFCANTMSVVSRHPDVFDPTWPNALAAARAADAMGLEAIVPIARWKGYLDDRPDSRTHEVFDTFTYAAAIAQATTHSAVFATSHAAALHPLIVAKQAATIDHISGGRFCLNIVGGVNRREFDMFGIDLLGHEERYEHLEEWLGVLRRLWTDEGEIDVDGRWFHLKKAISRPQPLQPGGIPIMNAGASESGMRFAARNSDLGLITLAGPDPAAWADQVAAYKTAARQEHGRDLQVWTASMLTIRDDRDEAQAYLRAYSEELSDHEAVESFAETIRVENNIPPNAQVLEHIRRGIAVGVGTPVAGTPADVAAHLSTCAEIGLDGSLLIFVDFLDGLERFRRQVLPLVEAAGLRVPFAG